jgi:hypothetical protein
MSRHFGCAMLIAVGMVLGWALGSYQGTPAIAAAQDVQAEEDVNREIVEELKEIRTQVKQINTLLQSGRLRVIDVINPGTPIR